MRSMCPAAKPVAPVRPEDEPGVLLAPQTPDQPGPYSGPYEAGADSASDVAATSLP